MEMEIEDGDGSERGVRTVVLDWGVKEEKIMTNRTLVGKLITEKALNKATVISMIRKGWNMQEGLNILESEENVFVLSFEKEEECNRILRGRPWSILGCLLNIQKWSDFKVIPEFEFDFSPFWIQFHNIPLEGLNRGNAMRLGSVIGEVVAVEEPIIRGQFLRSFIRVRVLVDLKKPLVAGFWVLRPGLSKIWIAVKYERLQQFCYRCGFMGHEPRGCKYERKMSAINPIGPMFGPWISAPPLKNYDEALVFCKEGWEEMEGKGKKARVISDDREVREGKNEGDKRQMEGSSAEVPKARRWWEYRDFKGKGEARGGKEKVVEIKRQESDDWIRWDSVGKSNELSGQGSAISRKDDSEERGVGVKLAIKEVKKEQDVGPNMGWTEYNEAEEIMDLGLEG